LAFLKYSVSSLVTMPRRPCCWKVEVSSRPEASSATFMSASAWIELNGFLSMKRSVMSTRQ